MGKGKKFLSLFLAVAMTVTGVNLGTAPMQTKAAETLSTKYYQEIRGTLAGSGGQDQTDSTIIAVKGNEQTTEGSEFGAPFTSDTASGAYSRGFGSRRVGCLQFTLPDMELGADYANLKKATITLDVKETRNTNESGEFTSIALYQTANPASASAAEAATYAARDNNYGISAVIWGDKKLSQNKKEEGFIEKGKVNFDVTEALKQAYTDGNNKLVLRVHTPHAGFVVYDERAAEANHPLLTIDATTDTSVTINYVDGQNNAIKEPKTVGVKVGSSYTYEVEESERILVKDGKTYNLSVNQNLTITEVSETAANNVINVSYEEDSLTGPTDNTPIAVTTRVGVAPNLPAKVNATFTSGNTADMDVTWDEVPASSYAKEGNFTVNGKFTGTEISVTANVTVNKLEDYLIADYSFDEDTLKDGQNPDNQDRNAQKIDGAVLVDGLAGKAVELPGEGKNKGAVKLPDDLLQVNGATQDDFTVSMFMKRKSQGNSFAMILHGTGVNQDNPAGHLGLINKNTQFRMEYRKDGSTKAILGENTQVTPVDQWMHIAIVTKGSTGEAWLYQDGVEVAYLENTGVKASDLTAQNNYIGRATWPDSDYAGTFDEFKVYNAVLTANEIKDICDATLYEAQIAKTMEVLQITSADENVTYDKDNVTANLNLPTEGAGVGTTIEWASSNDKVVKTDGTVIRPSGGNDANVTLTATIKAGTYSDTKQFPITVTALEGINFDGLTLAIKNAQAVYNQAVKENIYTDASLKALNDAIVAAQTVEAEKDKPDSTVTVEQVEKATADIEKAAKETLAVKSFEEVNKALQVWYPLDNDTKDDSGKGNDAAATGNVLFDRENGAVLPGGDKFTNYISLPADRLKVSDQMTFSFWAYDNRGGKSNAFGIGSGEKLYADREGTWAHHFSIFTEAKFSAKVGEQGWNGTYLKGVGNIDFAAQEWHLITCVLNGKKLQVYIDKELVGTEEVNVPLTTLWDADPETRYAYIGNCVYGVNGDKDYKGNIKDFRIYDACLTAEHVAAIYDYQETLPIKYAKEDLIKEMGAELQKDGTVTLNVTNLTTTDGKLDLKKTGYKDAVIAWTSADDNIINATTGAASIPALGEDNKTVNLTAEITLNGKKETVVFECTLFTRLDINTDDLQALVEEVEALTEADYTTTSWAALQTALQKAKKQVAQPTSEADVAAAKTELQNAKNQLEERGNKSALETLLRTVEALTETHYTAASWEVLQSALTEAQNVEQDEDAVQTEIDRVKAALQEAYDDLVDKSALDEKITAVEEKENTGYTTSSWNAFKDALQSAKTTTADRDATKQDIEDALQALTDAETALAPIGNKEELNTLIDTIEAENLVEEKYTATSWKALQDALTAAKEVKDSEDVNQDDVDQAKTNLQEARTNLTERADLDLSAISELISQAEKLQETEYTAESWAVFTEALNEAKAILENKDAVQADVDAAKSKLEQAIQGLNKINVTPKTYTVTFKDRKTETKKTVESGKKVAKPKNPTRSGYKFKGWFADGATKAFDFNTPITKNITLTAKWTKLTAISGATVKVAKATYTGKAQKPKVTVTYKGKTLKVNKDYKVNYGSYKKAGPAKVKITGIGNYTGTKTVSYNILTKKNKITKLTNGKGKKLTVKFSKATGAKGYEVSYATAKNFKKAKKKTTTKTSLTLTKLKKGKTYYVRVRSYIKVGKKKVYSAYSPVMKKKITK
ncbi:MAG: hypothetical protein HFI71_11765 [Lachnospiraceae bacterium]|nr:hypothetical protein [Lachnospiraceae bacterium]